MTDVSAADDFGKAALDKMRFIRDDTQVEASITQLMYSLRGHSRKVTVQSDHPHVTKLRTAFDEWRVPHRINYVEMPKEGALSRDVLDRPKNPAA